MRLNERIVAFMPSLGECHLSSIAVMLHPLPDLSLFLLGLGALFLRKPAGKSG
jgi:hypothetical protein